MFAAGGDVSMLSPVRRYGTMLESPVNLLNRKAGLNQTLILYFRPVSASSEYGY